MRILLTGAAGTLGSALIPLLAHSGDQVIGVDLRAGSGDATWFNRDIRDPEALSDLMPGVDMVVHTAAIHGIHLRTHSPRDFYDLNLTGTFNVWQAAVAAGVRGVVFSSTMGVYGDSRVPADASSVTMISEDLQLLPGDVYGWTKVVGEELCRYHFRRDGIPSIALRFGMFVPEPFFRYGIRLLYGGVHEADVAAAVVAALRALAEGRVTFEAFNVEALLPFTADDGPDLRGDPLVALERHWPGSVGLLKQRGVRSLRPINEVFEVSRIRERLGWQPKHGFESWLDELGMRPTEMTTDDPPWS